MHQSKHSTTTQIQVPELTLKKGSKVLYMTHLALGDYVYQGAFLKALSKQYPDVQIDVWIDDCRNKKKSWHSGRNSTLQQWLAKENHLNTIYPIASSNEHREQLIADAKNQQYDFIVFVATTRAPAYLKVAQAINANATIVGTEPKNLLSRLFYRNQYKSLSTTIALSELATSQHISDFYNHIFSRLFAVSLDEQQRSREILFTNSLGEQGKQQINAWRNAKKLSNGPTIFINHISTNEKRDWQLSQLAELTAKLTEKSPNTLFVLNAPPHKFDEVSSWCAQQTNIAVEAFSATKDFFELPSVMQACDLVISVETAIMHIASSLSLPQIALIRESASSWRPLKANSVLEGKKRVDNIAASEVVIAAENILKLA